MRPLTRVSSSGATMHALFLTLVLVFMLPTSDAKICSSMDIRNNLTQLEQLRDCTSIYGSLQIVLMKNELGDDFSDYSYPELTEITDYLLFYRVQNLRSLGKLFPNLTVIRGQNLFVNYALIIYEMFDLEEVGLYGLLKIIRGGVRIAKNYKLCYTKSVNWKIISTGEIALIENGQLCHDTPNKCNETCKHGCWNDKKCQKEFNKSCPKDCLFCTRKDECEICKNYIQGKKCVDTCATNLYHLKHLSKCVTGEECKQGNYTIYQDQCLIECPPKYENKNGMCVECESYCHKVCLGGMITNINTLEQFNGCTNITSEIIIKLDPEMKGDIEAELEKHLGNIEEIEENLKISRSMSIKNLNFLKNLRTIKGTKLEQGRYSLILHENQNLQKLWDLKNLNLKILNGTFSVHYNPKLCPIEIEMLAKKINLKTNYSYMDVSNYSNGDSFACSKVTINVQVVNVTENSAFLEWKPPATKDCKNTINRYVIYYKEVDDLEMYPEEEECGIPTWITAFAFNNENETTCDTEFNFNITELRTFTNYTYFIKTDNLLGGRSEIQYFTTLSGDPSVPMFVTAEPKDSTAIKISWQKPININGELSHYIVVGFIQEEDVDFIDNRDYCKVKLVEISTTAKSTVETTTEAALSNSTCVCSENDDSLVTVIQKEDFDAICSDLDRVTYNEPKGVHSHGCGSYKYQVIPSHKFSSLDDNSIKKDKKREGTTMQPNVSFNESDHFEKRVNGNETSFVIDNLKHYSIYILLLSACNVNRTMDPQCSSIVMVSERTGRKADADNILDVMVKKVNTYDVVVEWAEPADPNAVVVSYDIEYQNTHKEKSKVIVDCITRKHHQQANYKYKLPNLPPGKYNLRVRATSLAGAGDYSPYKTFIIEIPSQTSEELVITICLVLLLVLVILAVVIWRIKLKRSIENRQLIANVNPDYAGYTEDEWEIDRNDIEIVEELGQGTFGQVHKGIIRSRNIACAVKTVNEKTSIHDRMQFLNEATVMKSFQDAHHVIKLIGVVSRGTNPLVIMELMERGDLKTFLRSTRDSSRNLTCFEIYRMACEIADGMMYLASKKYVHRDLAARNCMVAADRTVKVGDFGMTRDVYETDYYRKETRGLMPVRWMSPESLADGVFTTDSDMWSYGIVLWEIATLAEQPYQGLSNEQVLQYVVARGTLDRPPQCPDLLYEIMIACWKWIPYKRPLFIEVVETLESHIGQDFRLVSYYHSREGEDYRRTKSEINRERIEKHNSAMPAGRVIWNRNDDDVRFRAETPTGSPASISLLSQQHSPLDEDDFEPRPGPSYSRSRYLH